MLRALLIVSYWVVCASDGYPAELGSRDQAIAIVKRVQASFTRNGASATFKAINDGAEGFRDHELYAFVYDLTGKTVAHGANPQLVGKNRIDFQDQDGKLVISEFIRTARTSGRGWVDYSWPNAVSVEDMTSYVERLGGRYVVGVPVLRTDARVIQALETQR